MNSWGLGEIQDRTSKTPKISNVLKVTDRSKIAKTDVWESSRGMLTAPARPFRPRYRRFCSPRPLDTQF